MGRKRNKKKKKQQLKKKVEVVEGKMATLELPEEKKESVEEKSDEIILSTEKEKTDIKVAETDESKKKKKAEEEKSSKEKVSKKEKKSEKTSKSAKKKGKGSEAKEETKTSKEDTDELEKDLRQIYQEDDGHMPDLHTLEKRRSRRLRNFLISLVLFFGLLAAVAWAGFFFFKPGAFKGKGVTVQVVAPEALVAGGEAEIIIRYNNREEAPLGSFEVAATLPDGFVLSESDPAASEGTRWMLGTIGSGQKGDIRLKGRITAGIGEQLVFSVYATYIPANFNSEFQSVDQLQVFVTDSVINAEISGLDRIPAGETLTYVLRYTNKSMLSLEHLAATLQLPEGFVLETTQPEINSETNRIPLEDLAADSTSEIQVVGSYESESSGLQTITATFGVVDEENLFINYAETAFDTEVIGSDLILTTVTNGISGDGRVNFGELLRTSLSYENRGSVDLHNVEIDLVYEARPTRDESSVLNFDTFRDDLEGARDAGRITWTKEQVVRLEKLEPNAEGTIDVEIQLADAPFTYDDRDYVVEISAEARVARVGDLSVGRAVRSGKNVLKVNSDLSFNAFARYFNDDDLAVGTGPVPPRVGATTTYRIFWAIENSLHELTDLSFKASLGEGVSLGERSSSSAGETSFDSDNQEVVWSLNKMPISVNTVEGEFDVVIIPSSEDNGNILNLIELITFEGADSVADGLIVRTIEPLTTNLETDPQVSGKGQVVR